MGSEILENDTMFSVKEKPWHNLGTVVTEAPSIEEGIRLAGLDWNVELENMTSTSGIESTTKKMSVKVDQKGNRFELGDVGFNYMPLQNLEAFNFFEPFIENDMVQLETAGSLFNGKKVFILGKINSDNLTVMKNDEVEKYVLLSNSHDGSTAVRVGFTPIRVVCNNTLKMAHEADLSQLIRVRHTSQVQTNLVDLRSIMDIVNQNFKTTVDTYKYLALRDINSADLKKYVSQVFSTKKLEKIIDDYEEREEIEQERKRLILRVEEIFEKEPARTMWNGYNAVQGYLQHEMGKDIDRRYNNLWFGNNERLNQKALNIAIDF